jgi:hypothetical protein
VISEDDLVGRRIVAVDLDNVPDGFAILTFDDGSALEIRTSKVGQLLLSSGEDAGLRP